MKINLQTLGVHLLIELFGCNKEILNDEVRIKDILIQVTQIIKVTPVKTIIHKFSPQGVTVIVIIAESHLLVHTWPEHGYAGCDIFTCGSKLYLEDGINYLVSQFEAKNVTIQEIKRGIVCRIDSE